MSNWGQLQTNKARSVVEEYYHKKRQQEDSEKAAKWERCIAVAIREIKALRDHFSTSEDTSYGSNVLTHLESLRGACVESISLCETEVYKKRLLPLLVALNEQVVLMNDCFQELKQTQPTDDGLSDSERQSRLALQEATDRARTALAKLQNLASANSSLVAPVVQNVSLHLQALEGIRLLACLNEKFYLPQIQTRLKGTESSSKLTLRMKNIWVSY